MSRRAALGLVVLVVAALLAPPPAQAQLYRWVNEQGEVHFTQGLENIPERFRAGARLLGYPEAAPAAPSPGPAPDVAAPVGRATPAPGGGVPPVPASVRGGARIPFTPGRPILVTVRVNGGLRTARLILDTGADRTLIHTRALAALGVDPSAGRAVSVTGVTGDDEGRAVVLESLEVGDARVAPFVVVAYDLRIQESAGDGLLGRDFLERFNMRVDMEGQVVILSPR